MELDPGERLRIMSGLLDFFIPKLNRTDHSMTIGDETIIIQLPSKSYEEPLKQIADGGGENTLLH